MRTRKVFKVYSALSDDQREQFGLFLASPYFGYSQKLQRFREILEAELVKKPQNDLSVKAVWFMGLGTSEFRPNGFDKLCAELLAAIHDYLATQRFRENANLPHLQLIPAYMAAGLDEWIPQLYSHLLERLDQAPQQDAEALHGRMVLLHTYGEFLTRQPRTPRSQHLADIDQSINAFFVASKLELAAAIDSHNRIFQEQVPLTHIPFLEELLKSEWDAFPLVVQLRAQAWRMMRGRKEEDYFTLKKMLSDQGKTLSERVTTPLYILCLNFAAFRLNEGDDSFESETDDHYQEILNRGIILKDGLLPPEHFKNLVALRLRLGKLDWVRTFIDQWQDKLTDNHQGAALTYNKAVLAFFEGDFRQCLRGMEGVLRDFKQDIYYGTDARIYGLMALYELSKHEDCSLEMETRLNAFRMYLNRENRLGQIDQDRYQNWVKQFRRLISFQTEKDHEKQKKARKFLESIAQMRPVSNRKWFENQILPFMK